MASIETPPNPAPVAPPQPPPSQAVKVATRFGELDHTELVHLLDSLEGDQSRSRFRESIYISVIVYLILAWVLVYGPRYLWHAGTVVPSAETTREKDRLTKLDFDHQVPPPPPKLLPKIPHKALEQLHNNDVAKAARQAPAPSPQPAAPAPAPTPAPAAQAQTPPLPSAPTPQPPPRPTPVAPSAIPDAPRPNTPSAQSPLAQSLDNASRNPVQPRPGGRPAAGGYSKVGQQGAGMGGVEILSDTRGVDFTEYIKKILRMIKAAWLPLIPEECYPPLSKEGTTLIHFTIAKGGALSQPMTLDDSTHDRAIDKAAWGSIVSVGQFPPLPAAYSGDTLELRIQFIISRNAVEPE